jgi:hypothetical protein
VIGSPQWVEKGEFAILEAGRSRVISKSFPAIKYLEPYHD